MGDRKRWRPAVGAFGFRDGPFRSWLSAVILLIAVAACIALGGRTASAGDISAPAQSKPPFGMMTGGSNPFAGVAQPTRETSALQRFVDRAWSLLLFEQHRLTQDMTGAVRNIKSSTSLATATSALVVASFVYGILHAVGPGHGKAVISSYMLADKETLRRGIFLAFLSSFIQALSAIALIGGLWLAARATGLETKWAEAWLETLSWACVAIVGAWLMLKQVWPLAAGRFARSASAQSGHEHARDRDQGGHPERHDHHHEHAHAYAHTHENIQEHVHDHVHGQGHDHGPGCACGSHDVAEAEHVHDEHCGHAHLPGPEELAGALSWRKAFAIAFSIGIRPCTGALLVIVFAAAQGAIWAGVLATFAMALGTAITVSALAALSVGSRNLAIYLAGAESHWGSVVARGASFLSSATVFVLGTAFFFASLHNTRPF